MSRQNTPRVSSYYAAFADRAAQQHFPTAKLNFTGVDAYDVYNITAPFYVGDQHVLAGRVERRDSEASIAIFFEEAGDTWRPIDRAPSFALQDPFVTKIAGEQIFGGVEITQEAGGLVWHTVLYRGPDIYRLRRFFTGPLGMKDIRLCELANGRIGVFTRPRGLFGGRGTIGYTEIASLSDLTLDAVEYAPLIDDMFHPQDWGGVNEARLLQDGTIGVLGHAAYFEGDDRDQPRRYYAIAFTFDPQSCQWRDYKIIAARAQFDEGAAKRPDLIDVVFPAGLTSNRGVTRLYAGVSDAEAHWVEIPYPFAAPLR